MWLTRLERLPHILHNIIVLFGTQASAEVIHSDLRSSRTQHHLLVSVSLIRRTFVSHTLSANTVPYRLWLDGIIVIESS
uniref:Uncharacterized protein n=1 Tax=Hyaloperonospora arabidopsidis (strain Emoy2) TaxID=559515 RepID=M4BND8_HYAAE